MKILKYKKMSKSRYKLTFDTNEIILYEDVIIKNNLLLTKDIDIELLEKVMEENNKYEAYDLSLSFIEYKLRTEKEIRDYLDKKGFTSNLIDETIAKLKKDNLINEDMYVKAFINDKINLNTSGPYKIKRELLDLGIEEEVIDNYLFTIKEDVWKEKLNKIINKKMNALKNKSLYVIKNKLKVDLFNLGYDKDLINEKLNNINKDDKEALKKEMSKLYDKLSKKYEGEELKRQIKNHLYKKGFLINDIDDYYE